jgi:protein-disulfide isomerase
VFSDFECLHCADLSAVLKRVRTDYPNDVLVAYRYFPIERHERAFPAAVAAECAAEQGAFWEYHDRLYAKGSDLSDASFASIASALGLDGDRFRECQASPRARAAVEASRADAAASGLDGVPALFLNGRKVGGMIDYERLVQKIRDVLKTPATAKDGAREEQRGDRKETQ